MDGKRNSRSKQGRKRTSEEIEAIKRRKARARWEEALRDSDNNYERRVKKSKENTNHNRRTSSKRVNLERNRNTSKILSNRRPKDC